MSYSNGYFVGGRLSNFYLDYDYRDLSQETNRRLFITADGKPADNQESLSPIIYLPLKDATTAGQNLGTGGNFTVNGTLSTSERGPNQYNASAASLNGPSDYLETSFLSPATDNQEITVSFWYKQSSENLLYLSGWRAGNRGSQYIVSAH